MFITYIEYEKEVIMKKVLIVSYYFPPLNTIAAKRYGTMCKYFRQNGYDAYVLTTTLKECQFLSAKRDLELPIPKEKIIRIGKGERYGKAETERILLLEAILKKYKLDFRTISIEDLFWYKNVKRTCKLAELKDIDIVIGTYGPIGNVYIAKYIAKKLGCPCILDIRDLISEWQEAPEGYKRCMKIDNILEKMLLSSTDGIVTVTEGFKAILKKKYPKVKVAAVFNGWDGKASVCSRNVQQKYLFYAGSLYEHRLESYALLLKALKKVNEKETVKLVIRSIGPKTLDNKAKRIAVEMGVDDIVEILPSVAEDALKCEQGKAYINVILNSIHEENRDQMTTIPGKTYELLHESAPVLAVTSKKSDLAQIVSYTKKGIASISEEEIEGFVLRDNIEYTGNDNVTKFSREYQAERLCRFIDKTLKKK